MNFTNSPFERMMKEKPRPQAPTVNQPPRGSACRGCSYSVSYTHLDVYKRQILNYDDIDDPDAFA